MERTIELDKPLDEQEALAAATERAEKAEAELKRLHAQQHSTEGRANADTAVGAESTKQPPTPSTAANHSTGAAPLDRGEAEVGGLDELRKEPVMVRLLDALDAGQDVGHYGRLTFAMVARHFLPHDEVVSWLTKDADFSEAQADSMLQQVDDRDYSAPKRERLLEWQSEQEFQFVDVHDPDSGNFYRNLKFPQAMYQHIEHYQEAKHEA